MCLGSSLTWGTSTNGGYAKEPGGGYPDKLPGLILADVRNRGWPGSTAGEWSVCGDKSQCPSRYYPNYEASLWQGFIDDIWPDMGALPNPLGATLGQTVVRAGPRVQPTVVISMLGLNDNFIYGSTAQETFNALLVILGSIANEPGVAKILVNTELTLNTRDPPDYISGYNDLIRTTFGANVIDMATEFIARGGNSSMFGDGLHPDCDGYTIMAQIAADGLVARGLALPNPTPSLPTCPTTTTTSTTSTTTTTTTIMDTTTTTL